jgi:LacI family transcriptional regulator
MRATIKDVAKKSGFSITTVSMVLNNKPVSISNTTKEKIRVCAEELNYRPNRLAYGMSKNNSNSIGLILPNNQNSYFSELSEAIHEEASNNGFNILVSYSNSTPTKDIDLINLMINCGVDAIILACANISTSHIPLYENAINKCPIPIIQVDRKFENTKSSSVMFDNTLGGYIATKHLLDNGHSRIGCIAGPNNFPGCQARLQGYRKALSEYNIDYDETLIYFGKYDIETGRTSLSYLLGKNVSAIFAFADMIAYGLYKEAHLYNIKIPDDLSVIGFDDVFFSDLINPPLTTVAQPFNLIAKSTIEKITSLIRDDSTLLNDEFLAPVLKVRGSTKKLPVQVIKP